MPSLTKLAPNLWIIDSTFSYFGLKGSTRSTVIRLKNGKLWLHSPIHISESLHAEINKLGEVTYIVAPNNMHYLYFEECLKLFPKSHGYVANSLVKKYPRFNKYPRLEALAKTIHPEINQLEVQGHILGETVFFHKPSGTLIVTDLLYNLQPHHLWFEKLVMRLWGAYGKPSIPLYHKIAIKNPTQLRHSIHQITNWPIKRIIMAHGEIITGSDASSIFHTSWKRICSINPPLQP